MGIFRQFPYSNFHDMNMDTVLRIMREMQDEWAATKTEWASYKDFIDNYFANLDVSEEVLAAIRVMAASGELNTVIDPVIAEETASWLADHITPTTPPVDNSLTIAGAAADAEATGDAIRDIYAINTQVLTDRFPVFTASDFEAGALSQSGETGSPYTIRTKHFYNVKNANIKFTGVLETGRYCYPYFYDDNFTWVSRFTGDWTNGYDVPDNATYLRFVYGFTSASGQTVENYGFNNLVNDFAVEMINNTVKDIYNNIDYIQTGVINNPVTDIAGKYIAYADGTLVNNSNYHATDFIEIPEYTNLIETNCLNSIPGTDGYAFYNSAKEFISSGKCANIPSVTKIKVPANAKYIRLCSRYSYEPENMVIYVHSLGYIQQKSNKDYTVVMLGDSIIGNYNSDTSVPAYLENFSGAKCYNCAFGGSNLGTDTIEPVSALLLPFRGFKVIDAIVNNNYTDMDNAIAADPNFDTLLDYYPDHVNKLKNMDWDNVDIITMSWGTNDWGTGVTVADNALNPKDTDTFGGALRTALETLWATYPHIKVMICGVIWRGGTISGGQISWSSDSHPNTIGAYLKEYEEKAEEVAAEYHAPFVKMYDFTNINEHTWSNYFPVSGSNATHPNAKGRYVIAKRYSQHLAEL